MSIIDQALKKTQQAREEKSTPANKVIKQMHYVKAFKKTFSKSILFLTLFVFSAALCSYYLINVKHLTHHPLTLNGTAAEGNHYFAMINHHLYHVGDQVAGIKLTKIDDTHAEGIDTKTNRHVQFGLTTKNQKKHATS